MSNCRLPGPRRRPPPRNHLPRRGRSRALVSPTFFHKARPRRRSLIAADAGRSARAARHRTARPWCRPRARSPRLPPSLRQIILFALGQLLFRQGPALAAQEVEERAEIFVFVTTIALTLRRLRNWHPRDGSVYITFSFSLGFICGLDEPMRKQNLRHSLKVRITSPTQAGLTRIARARQVSLADVVREALLAYLAARQATEEVTS